MPIDKRPQFWSYCIGDLAFPDIQEYLKVCDIIMIPMASLEQHGPHLPLYTDTITALEVAKRTAEQARILYTPPIWMGYSPQHMRTPGGGTGTITVRPQTLLNLLHDVARSCIHHGFSKLIFVNGHGSNIKVIDPLLRKLRYDTGALVTFYKPYAERYMGMIKDVLENPPEETPGWHSSELETAQVMAHNPKMVRMDRAVKTLAHKPAWLPQGFKKVDGAPDVEFDGYQYFQFPMDHTEFTETGVIGNPFRATAAKGEECFKRFAAHLVKAIDALENVPIEIKNREWKDTVWSE